MASDGQQLSLQVLHSDAATITLLIDAEFFEAQPSLGSSPADWEEAHLKTVCPENFSSVRLFIARAGSSKHNKGQVVAAQFDLRDYDAVSGTRLLQARLPQWSEEFGSGGDKRTPAASVAYDRKTGRAILRPPVTKDPFAKAHYVPSSQSFNIDSPTSPSPDRPTLFSLLARLSDPSVTTVEQRFAIRHIITDYLNNEISHGKVFSYLGQVVGYQALDDIISSLPTGVPTAHQQTAACGRIQQTLNLNEHPPTPTGVVVGTAPGGAPAGVQRQEGPRFTPSVAPAAFDEEDISALSVRRQKGLLFKTLVKPLTWISPRDLLCPLWMSWGQSVVLLDRKAFFLGGCPLRSLQRDPDVPVDPTFEAMRVVDLGTLQNQKVTTDVNGCPPSTVGHTAHLGSFGTGPLTVVYGGMLASSAAPIRTSRTLSPLEVPEEVGTVQAEADVQFNNGLFGLDMVSRCWMCLDEKSDLKPPPRHSHASTIFPNATEVITGSSAPYAEFLMVFGGVGKKSSKKHSETNTCSVDELVCLNDMWIFSFLSGQWTQISSSPEAPWPTACYGMSFSWISDTSALFYGGEGRGTETERKEIGLGTPNGNRMILSDSWILSIKIDKSDTDALPKFVWTKPPATGPPRAHYAAVGLTACLPPAPQSPNEKTEDDGYLQGLPAVWSSSVESAMKDMKSLGWVTQRVIVLISGTTRNAENEIYETPSVLLGLVFPKPGSPSSFLVVWKSLDQIPASAGHLGPSFRGRRNHSALYFDAAAQLPSEQMMQEELKAYKMHAERPAKTERADSPIDLEIEAAAEPLQRRSYKSFGKLPTSVPCILVVGGFVEGKRQVREDLWILKLSKLLPKILKSSSMEHTVERRLLLGLVLSGVKCTPALSDLLQLDQGCTELDDSSNNRGFAVDELKIMKQVWSDPSRNFQPALSQVGGAASTGLIWCLATMVKQPLSSFGHLVDNAMQKHVKASSVSICFERFHDHEVISVTDDGGGLNYKNLHLLLKRFGHASDDLSKKHPDQFGLGFKLAVGRLAHNALVITKSTWSIGVGLFSVPLNALMGTTSFACPIACWSCSDGFPLVLSTEEAEFGQTLGMILHNSPLTSAANLELEFQKFGKGTGTRVILFGLRKDLPYPFLHEGSVKFSSYRHPEMFEIPNSINTRVNLPATVTSHLSDLAAFQPGLDADEEPPQLSFTLPAAKPTPEDSTMASVSSDLAIQLPGSLSNISASLTGEVKLSSEFPLWSSAAASPDYDLATYLFWSQLHGEATVYINGQALVPETTTANVDVAMTPQNSGDLPQLKFLKESGIRMPDTDRYGHSLYRFLQSRLHYKLELPFLWEPKFGESRFYGLVGFLNNHLEPSQKDKVCEAGVMLYHKGRLINRAMLKMPLVPEFFQPSAASGRVPETANCLSGFTLTAVINVPDFLLPRATKEEFIAESDLAFHDFYDRLEATLREYLTNYWDAPKLEELQKRYVNEFDAFREAKWNERRRIRSTPEEETVPAKKQTISSSDVRTRSPDSPKNGIPRRPSPPPSQGTPKPREAKKRWK